MPEASPRAFVVGHPIAHSRSPLIHGFWLRELGLAGSYERVDVAPAVFAAFIDTVRAGAFAGGNVTIPHKEAAWRLVDRRDRAADAIGAVNTLWMEDGQLCGGNTDAFGYAADLDDRVPTWRDAEVAVVLGAGGAARAIVHVLGEAGFGAIRVVNRDMERAETLRALADGVSVHGWQEVDEALGGGGLLVNTTSLGMSGSPMPELDLSRLDRRAIVSDIVYTPLETPLLARAAAAGLRTVDGLGMLLHQAVPGFERWFGVRPRVTAALRAHVLEGVGEAA